jgi:predicted nucleic acid-binding protein
VDSSVWIALFRNAATPQVQRLLALRGTESILVGDLILLEVLRGARDDRHAATLERELRHFPIAALLNEDIALDAARYYRDLRGRGITMHKTIDLIIGTFCLARGHALLHDDRDFLPMQSHLGLRAA